MTKTWYKNAVALLDEYTSSPNLKYARVIERIGDFFLIGMYVDITFKTKGWGFIDDKKPNKPIVIGAHLKPKDIILTIIHEAIHQAWDIDHNKLAREAGYWSYKHGDKLSELIATVIFKSKSV